MATCNDCIHNEACKSLIPRAFWDSETFCEDCKYFKDKSRFIELPCKVGDTAYWIDFYRNQIYPIKITGFEIDYNMDCDIHCFGKGYTPVFVKIRDSIGKNFFFTREEAEKSLKERETGMNCLDCKFSNGVVRDNHDELHGICICVESEHFLTEIDLFDSCAFGEEEREEEE